VSSSNGGSLLVISVHGDIVVPAVEGEEFVIVVLLPTRVVNVGTDLVAGDDGSNTTAGSTLTRRDSNHRLGTSRDEGEGSGESQSESGEVLHCW